MKRQKTTRAKLYVAFAIQTIGQALTLGILPQSWRPYAEGIVGAATLVGVERTYNAPVSERR